MQLKEIIEIKKKSGKLLVVTYYLIHILSTVTKKY